MSALVLVIGCLALASSVAFPPIVWLVALMLGAGGGALYTLAIIEVGRSRDTASVAMLTSAAVSAYTLGAVIGPLGGGLVLDLVGSSALWLGLILPAIIVFLITFTRLVRPNQET